MPSVHIFTHSLVFNVNQNQKSEKEKSMIFDERMVLMILKSQMR
jgi:predicted lactoylglutathione lyase